MTPPPFQRLLDEHAAALLRFCAAAAGPADAEDCFQETVLAALRAYPGLRHTGNLRGWLWTIAHAKAMDAHRARARRPVPVPERAETPARPEAERPDDALWSAVAGLPDKQRGAVLLRFVGDLSHREIATALGSSEQAARRSLADGLSRLRQEWTPG